MKKALIASAWFLPILASAATLTTALNTVKDLLDKVIPILFVIALIVFFWGVIMYVVSSDKKDAIKYIIWGLVGLAVMAAVWGLVNLLTTTFGVDTGSVTPPKVPDA